MSIKSRAQNSVILAGALVALWGGLGPEAVARAQGDEAAPEFLVPPAPDNQSPRIAGEVHLDLAFALADSNICPSGGECVFNSGGGIGGALERRYPSGAAVGIGYDAWFLDGNGVYELATLQVLRGYVKYLLLHDRFMHPFFGVGVGGVLFGDSFRVESVGGALDFISGVELEVSPTLAVTTTLTWRLVMNTAFTTENDMFPRSQSPGVNVALGLQFGLVILEHSERSPHGSR